MAKVYRLVLLLLTIPMVTTLEQWQHFSLERAWKMKMNPWISDELTTLAVIQYILSTSARWTRLHGWRSGAKWNCSSWNLVRYSIWYDIGDCVRRMWKWDRNFIPETSFWTTEMLPFTTENNASWSDVVVWIYLELPLKENKNDVWELFHWSVLN